MLVRCKLIRHPGTDVEVGGTSYSFRPNDVGDHVCEITEEAHIQRLLLIPDAYEPYDEAAKAEVATIVARENALTADEERVIVVPLDLQNATYEELVAEYRREFGRAANPIMKHETLVKKLTAQRMKKKAPTADATQ